VDKLRDELELTGETRHPESRNLLRLDFLAYIKIRAHSISELISLSFVTYETLVAVTVDVTFVQLRVARVSERDVSLQSFGKSRSGKRLVEFCHITCEGEGRFPDDLTLLRNVGLAVRAAGSLGLLLWAIVDHRERVTACVAQVRVSLQGKRES